MPITPAEFKDLFAQFSFNQQTQLIRELKASMSITPAEFKEIFAQFSPKQQIQLIQELEAAIDREGIGTTPVQIRLEVLPANNGDTLVLGYQDAKQEIHQIWIDGGLGKSYREHHQAYLNRLHKVGGKIDLMMVTHIDQDHIGGVLAFANDASTPAEIVKQFWFNSGLIISKHFDEVVDATRSVALPDSGENSRSIREGIDFESFLTETNRWHETPIMLGQVHRIGDASLTILTPNKHSLQKLNEKWEEELEKDRSTAGRDYEVPLAELAAKKPKEDRSIANESSISFLFEHGEVKILFLADAHSSDVGAALKSLGYSQTNKIKVDALKLSHHGSKASNTYDLLDLVDCQQYIISTDGSRHGLPNKEAMARIILHPDRKKEQSISFIFNFDNDTLRSVFTTEEMEEHNFKCVFPSPDQQGVALDWTTQI
ncbi:MAG: ComEC/Rec2 family competence protein [Bacteroidia bacterium]